jgi:CHAD domain-containing protein
VSPAACATDVSIRDFGRSKTEALLQDAVEMIQLAAKSPKPEAIHRMRVSIRRLQQSIRLFHQFLRPKGVRAVRAEMRSVMEPAGEVRNLDIACSLIRRAGGDAAPLRERRVAARAAFQGMLAALAQPDLQSRWRRQLGFPNEQKEEEILES